MRVSQQLIDEQHAANRCDGCGGCTVPHGSFWDAEYGRRIELCNLCAVRIGGSLIADALETTEPAVIVRALGDVTRRVWECSRRRTERERLVAENAAHGS